MFKAVTSNPKLLRDSIDTISLLIDDGLFRLKGNGIELTAADRATVSFVDFKLKSSAFDEYECDAEKDVGLNMINFLTILKRANTGDKMTLSLDEKENKLEVILDGVSKRKFAIPLIEIRREEMPQVDKLEFMAEAEVRSDVIEQGINDADIIADSIIIEISSDTMKMYASGNSSKSELKLFKGTDVLTKLETPEDVSSRYSIDYLKKMVKGSKISDKISLKMGKDFPLRMGFENKDAVLNIVLAPRVSEE
ncbi:MAG: proliferating cell nuclear antigen (pcna) [Candidatus Aenigmarchaeota archaeon]|nr:proliferating cell nuclear antigen (pcna) [Candidatus Aenigmarchaeota archaeon]